MCETAISADVCASLTALKMLRPKAGWMKPVMLLKATALQLPCSLSKHPRVQFFEAEGEHTFGAQVTLPPASVNAAVFFFVATTIYSDLTVRSNE